MSMYYVDTRQGPKQDQLESWTQAGWLFLCTYVTILKPKRKIVLVPDIRCNINTMKSGGKLAVPELHRISLV